MSYVLEGYLKQGADTSRGTNWWRVELAMIPFLETRERVCNSQRADEEVKPYR